jgi:hypothetical protein
MPHIVITKAEERTAEKPTSIADTERSAKILRVAEAPINRVLCRRDLGVQMRSRCQFANNEEKASAVSGFVRAGLTSFLELRVRRRKAVV